MASGLGGLVDGAVLQALRQRYAGPSAPRAALDERARPGALDRAFLSEAVHFYGSQEAEARFLAAPPRPRVTAEPHRRLPDGGHLYDLVFPSEFSPVWPRLRASYLAHEPNRLARARLFAHPRPAATTIVCLHGLAGGAYFVEERAFAARWLYGLGLDVLLFVLPFHGRRGQEGAPLWPSIDPAHTNEGFAHALFDLRAISSWLASPMGEGGVRRGATSAPRLAVVGMSLGGYLAALWATVDALDLVAPLIPAASFAELFWRHGALTEERARLEREGVTLELLVEAMAVHTPERRVPRVPPARVLVASAEGDRIAPASEADRLARHFGVEARRFPGGHVLQFGRSGAFRALAQRLGELGLIAARPPSR
jgi:pimeloyl-ACP methyl ester carboxylesterase